MGSSATLSVSSVTQRIRFGSEAARSRRIDSSDTTVSLQELKAHPLRSRTPQQFRQLLEDLRRIVPYQKLAGVWDIGHKLPSVKVFETPEEAFEWLERTPDNKPDAGDA